MTEATLTSFEPKKPGGAYRMRAKFFLLFLSIFFLSTGWALQPEKPLHGLEGKAFFKPDLAISSANVELSEIVHQLPNRRDWDQFLATYGRGMHVYIDPRSAVPTSIIGHVPMIPGNGADNRITLEEVSKKLGRNVDQVDARVVADLVKQFVLDNRKVLALDVKQLGKIEATQITDHLWQVSIPQQVKGIPVRYGRIAATISHGNLIVIGTESWADVTMDTLARVPKEKAIEKGFQHAGGKSEKDKVWKDATLEVVPYAPAEYQSGESFNGPIGKGYRHRVVWAFGFKRDPDDARWEVLVDAQNEELLSFQDANHYVKQNIRGAVYPLTSTEVCPSNEFCGIMQSAFPMPWANTGLAAPNNFANSAGVFDYTSGNVTTTLSGKYVRISDACGAVSYSQAGSMNLGGSNGQHDCTTPGFGGAGNTASARSAFYEINKIAEQARSWLPTNTWLQSQLTANVNINNTCNGFWNGSTVNFYRSGGGCRNTGELAGVFDHEWGHGMDDNDAAGVLSNSSEAYADIAAIYRYQASCIGHGFFWTADDGCGQTADGTGFNANESINGTHCDTNCSGVRDADWAKHNPNTPDTPQNFVCSQCSSSTGPCGRQVHCAAAPVRQAAWDLVTRDLTAAPFNYNSNTAFMIGNKIFYQGSGNVGTWHACDCTAGTSNGCGATNGYIQWLTADDDNGNLNDGTPHMTAIYAAFNRHNIACSTPAPVNSGCSGGPTTAPTVTATPGDHQVNLSWNAVSGASKYWVLRTEGHAGCSYGKANLTYNQTLTGTSFTDTEVVAGRTYNYNVVAVGSSNACYGTAQSGCTSAVPTGGGCTNPGVPSLISPVNSAANVALTPALDWSDVSGATSYDVQVATDSGFTNVVRSASALASSTWTVSPALGNSTVYYWRARANNSCGSSAYSSAFSFTTVSGGGGCSPSSATYDSTLRAPKCSSTSACGCDSSTLLNSRGTLNPAEPNQPNTINNSCADGTSGTYHSDESLDKIVIQTTDGSVIGPSKQVKVDVTVWCWGTADALDLYYTSNANGPSWTALATNLACNVSGQAKTFTHTFTLAAANGVHAVRGQFRYQGTASSCTSGSYNDRDDLIFQVGTSCTAPGAPALLTPASGATGQSTTPVLDWNDVSGATSYDVQVATDSAFTNVIRSANALASSTWTVSPALSSGTTYYWRARANNTCGAGAWSSGFSFATAGASCGTSSQLFLNPGFESGAVNWVQSVTGVITNSASRPARTGTWKAWTNGYGTTSTEWVYQQIAIPSAACTAQLSFWIRIDSAETTTTTIYDRLRVEILNSSGTVLATLATYSNLNKNTTYTQKTFDLSAYKGQTIRVRFYGTEDSSLQTSFVMDDTAVNITQ